MSPPATRLGSTVLSPAERRLARARLAALAERLAADGVLASPVWRQVFTRTWRHPYVPAFYPAPPSPELLSAAVPEQRARWLDAVYTDQTLITRVIHVPAAGGAPGGWRYASSSSLPSVVLGMLEALDIRDGARVLEIGTGSGYNAALLCQRLGGARVTSVDIDPLLVDAARRRLAENGHTPTLAAVDGAGGYPPAGPYDRILATCSVSAIPPAWLAQTTPGGMIMADVRGLLGGAVARLTVTTRGTDKGASASGRFLPRYYSFMPLRADPDTFPPIPARHPIGPDARESTGTLDPTLLHRDAHARFVAQWPLADLVSFRPAHDHDGGPATQLETADGSIARIGHTRRAGGYPVTQSGPRRLWDAVTHALTLWRAEGRPGFDRYGITATEGHQYIWYDHPHGPHRWPLPPTGAPGPGLSVPG